MRTQNEQRPGQPASGKHRLSRWRGIGIETDLRPYRKTLDKIEQYDFKRYAGRTLTARTAALKTALGTGVNPENLLPEIFALTAEWAARKLGLRPFAVQLLAGIALAQGKLVELATGEGKTLAAVFPAVYQAFTGRGVHVMTANDYLAERDARWMGPVFRAMGVSVSFIGETMSTAGRRAAYAADITYVTVRQAGFDFLRDSLALRPEDRVHRNLNRVIVDEADCIMIDEARVPLVLAAQDMDAAYDPVRAAAAVSGLEPGVDFMIDRARRSLHLTLMGERRLCRRLEIGGLHERRHRETWAAVHTALQARHILRRDTDYIVRNDRIVMVDELTGRIAPDRRWPFGLQAALEAKEGLSVRRQGRIYGSVIVQHFLNLYAGRSGLTATAVSAAEELERCYGLSTVVIPTHRPVIRRDIPDAVFLTRRAKLDALLEEIGREHATGRPLLVGTRSVEESEELARLVRGRGWSCRVLNAKHDQREATVVARAGEPGSITIATNMAGRGTDIRLGGRDARQAALVRKRGGLYVIGTSRHESVRIDRQLRGRAGRQGDPGASRIFVSLEDELFQRYGMTEFLPRATLTAARGCPAAEIDDRRVRREIERAQSIISQQHSLMRRSLRRYSALVEEQRLVLAGVRRAALVDRTLPEPLAPLYGRERGDGARDRSIEILLHAVDRFWADHLAAVEDLREGIQLQRYGGREPLQEFIRLASDLFAVGWAGMIKRCGKLFRARNRKASDSAFSRAPGSTWTYALDEEDLPSFSLAGFGGGFSISVFSDMVVAVVRTVARWIERIRGRRI